MKKAKDYWEIVYDEFIRLYPELGEKIVDWYPSGQMEIAVKLKGGKCYGYDWMRKVKFLIYNPEKPNERKINNEEDWRIMFARKLNHKLYNTATNQDILAIKTGISEVTISKYINAKATPSAYNLHRIACALKCSVSELID